jgi:hypothetical protein
LALSFPVQGRKVNKVCAEILRRDVERSLAGIVINDKEGCIANFGWGEEVKVVDFRCEAGGPAARPFNGQWVEAWSRKR